MLVTDKKKTTGKISLLVRNLVSLHIYVIIIQNARDV